MQRASLGERPAGRAGADDAAIAPQGRLDVLVAAGTFFVALAWFSLTVPYGLELRDEGFLYGLAERVLAGEIPHRDFREIYGPGSHWLTAAFLKLAGGRIVGVRMLIAIVKAIAVALSYWIGRSVATRPIALGGTILAIAFWGRAAWKLDTPYASIYTLVLALGAVAVLIDALRRDDPGRFAMAGVCAGSAVLFKQSIGVMVLYGSGLAVLAAALLTPSGDGPRHRDTRWLLGAWALAAVAVLIPFAGYLNARDYGLHVLPLHAGMAMIAWAGIRFGGGAALGTTVSRRLLPLALGAAVPLATTALLYLWWGGLGRLVDDMFVLPGRMIDYYDPVSLPGPATLAWLGAAVCGVSALLLGLARRPRAAAPFGFGFVALGALALGLGSDAASLVTAPDDASGVVPALAVTACWIACWHALRSPHAAQDATLGALVTLGLFQCMLVVQIYPRAGFKLMLLQAATVPLLIGVLDRWSRLAGEPARTRHPWRVAACLAPLIVWMAWPAAQPVVALHGPDVRVHALDFPETRGLRVTDFEYRSRRMGDFVRLVGFLRGWPDPDAPVLLLSNQAMALLLGDHPSLLADRPLELSFVGWHRLPREWAGRHLEPVLLARLQERADALVVTRAVDAEDRTPHAFRLALPRLHARLAADYEEIARFGVYRVLRRAP